MLYVAYSYLNKTNKKAASERYTKETMNFFKTKAAEMWKKNEKRREEKCMK